jgi:hypothetical protein
MNADLYLLKIYKTVRILHSNIEVQKNFSPKYMS